MSTRRLLISVCTFVLLSGYAKAQTPNTTQPFFDAVLDLPVDSSQPHGPKIRDTMLSGYNSGVKHYLILKSPIEIGIDAAVILDLDDIAGVSVEGRDGWVTISMRLGLTLGGSVSLPFGYMTRATNRNIDPSGADVPFENESFGGIKSTIGAEFVLLDLSGQKPRIDASTINAEIGVEIWSASACLGPIEVRREYLDTLMSRSCDPLTVLAQPFSSAYLAYLFGSQLAMDILLHRTIWRDATDTDGEIMPTSAPDFVPLPVSFSPSLPVTSGNSITVNTGISNQGNIEASCELHVLIDGSWVAGTSQHRVTIAPGDTVPLSYSVDTSALSPGNHRLDVEVYGSTLVERSTANNRLSWCLPVSSISRPVAQIMSIDPSQITQGQGAVVFQGAGHDTDSTGQPPEIRKYRWFASLGKTDGKIVIYDGPEPSFSIPASDLVVGTQKISLCVQDNDGPNNTPGEWSEAAVSSLAILPSQTGPGSLEVTILPAEAVADGAQWRRTGMAWRNNGETENGLSAGSYTVGFKDVNGWSKPANKTVTIASGQTTCVNGTYTQLTGTGTLKVTITPAEARADGAQWRRVTTPESSWRNSGATEDLLSGDYPVEFKDVASWNTPSLQIAIIRSGQTTIANGPYMQNGPMTITTVSELEAIGQNSDTLKGHYVLGADIDASGATNFDPIGNGDTGFSGILDGAGFKITGLTINRPATDFVGLFAMINGGQVRNLTLENCSVTGQGQVGGLAGENYYGLISGCSATGNVTGTDHVGVLVGENNSSRIEHCSSAGVATGNSGGGSLAGYNTLGIVLDCNASGNATGSEDVGGLLGHNDAGTVEACSASGTASGSNLQVGGLVGYNRNGGTIKQCNASGAATGGSRVGGLVGYNSQGTVERCYADGAVKGTNNYPIGGLVGENNQGTVKQCYATGSVTANNIEKVGGLVGFTDGGIVQECYASGAVTGKYLVGGLVGHSRSTISDCCAIGSVTGLDYVGGLVGMNDSMISRCYATGQVTGGGFYIRGLVGNYSDVAGSYWDTQTTGRDTPGSGTGKTTAEMKQQATFSNWDFTTIWGIASNTNSGYPYLRAFGPEPTVNQPPDTPINIYPFFDQERVPQSTIVVGSAFIDPDLGDIHSRAQFQVAPIDGEFSSPTWDSGEISGGKTYSSVPTSATLTQGRYYRWRCRYQDDKGAWSAWSNETVFQTSPARQTAASHWMLY